MLFASGYSAESPVARLALQTSGTTLIQKPYNLKDLLRRVRVMIDEAARPGAAPVLDSSADKGQECSRRAHR